jgi:hypothetical protein
MLSDHAHQLKAVLLGHADIHENDSDLATQKVLERLPPGLGLDEIFPELLENNLIA